jgi:hypothetical protein
MSLRSFLFYIVETEEPGVYKIREVPWLTGSQENLQRWIDNPGWYG